jgi:hypothetical protein
MTFDLTPTAAQHDLARRAREFAESVIRPVALEYDPKQEFPWPVLEEAAQRGSYSPLFYRDLIGDPTGLSLPMFMEELFWGCAGIGLAIVMPALALSAIGQAASPEQMLEWAPPGREVVSRCQAVQHLRGHQRDSADRHLHRARRQGRCAAAARRTRTDRRAPESGVRPRHPVAGPSCRRGACRQGPGSRAAHAGRHAGLAATAKINSYAYR